MMPGRRLVSIVTTALLAWGMSMPSAAADHAWGGYHWARTANPFTVTLGDNVSSAWGSYLRTTSADWTKSTVLDTTIVAGSTSSRRCRAVSGRVEVCSNTYGNTGWLGVAGIQLSGKHITAGYVKVNDTYFNTARYDTPAWRNLVMCQEVGHTLGLHHQDEDLYNANLGTCMDYTNDPSSNQHPNSHDYDELVSIYNHLDSTTTLGSATAGSPAAGSRQDEWGRAIRSDAAGRPILFVNGHGGGRALVTFVIWA